MKDINLLPKEYRLEANNNLVALILGIFLLCTTLATGMTFWYQSSNIVIKEYTQAVNQARLRVDALKKQLKPFEKTEALKEQIEAKEDLINSLQKQDFPWDKLLLELQEHIPKDIRVQALLFGDNGQATISGESDSQKSVAYLYQLLQQWGLFEEVWLTSEISTKEETTKDTGIIETATKTYRFTFTAKVKGKTTGEESQQMATTEKKEGSA